MLLIGLLMILGYDWALSLLNGYCNGCINDIMILWWIGLLMILGQWVIIVITVIIVIIMLNERLIMGNNG